MSDVLKLVLTDHWFEEIKSGRKTHEYRVAKKHWVVRIRNIFRIIAWSNPSLEGLKIEHSPEFMPFVEFTKGYVKNAEKMVFRIKSIQCLYSGIYTDLKIDKPVFDIELGERIK